MITATQLVLHVLGDYILQNEWIAKNKLTNLYVSVLHALLYVLPFVIVFNPDFLAILVMTSTHSIIDRFRLARYVVWFLNGRKNDTPTGHSPQTPAYMAVWLLIIVDNFMHIVINGAALKWL